MSSEITLIEQVGIFARHGLIDATDEQIARRLAALERCAGLLRDVLPLLGPRSPQTMAITIALAALEEKRG